MDKENRVKAYTAATIFAVLVGFSFLGVKTCVPLASTLQILTYRYNWAFLGLLILLAARIGRLQIKGKSKKNLVLTAGFYIAFMVLQTFGLIFATSIESAIIFALVPIAAKLIAAVVLGEHSTWKQNVFVCLSVAALVVMIILSATDISTNLAGVFILVLSSLCMAISNVFMRYVREEYQPIEITAMIAAGGFVIFNLATIVHGIYTGTLGTYFAPLSSPAFVISTVYLGTGCILVSAQLTAYAMRYMEAVKVAIFGNLSTAISIVAGALFLREPLLPYHIVCTALIIAGVIGVSIAGKPAVKEEKDDKNSILGGK